MLGLTPEELSARWSGEVSTSTLAHWRSQGRGPDYMKIGRKIWYPLDKVEAYERANTVCHNPVQGDDGQNTANQ